MSAVRVEEKQATSATGSSTLVRLLPVLILALAIIGAIVVLPMVGHDQSAKTWYRNLIGGSELYRIDTIFARLVPFIIGAGIAVALLERGRRKAPAIEGDSLRRHELSEVITHWGNAVGVGLCLITAAWLLRWFHRPVSLETTYIVHFIGAGLVIAAVAHHITFQRVGGGTGLVPNKRSDFKNAAAELVSYTGVYRGLPGAFGIQLPASVRRPIQKVLRKLRLAPDPDEKYLATEKVLSYSLWVILLGIMVITGIIKTLRYAFGMPAGFLHWATYFHDGATIFIVALLVLHVAAIVLVPRNWPLLKSMFTTKVSLTWAKQHLPLWAEEEEAAQKG